MKLVVDTSVIIAIIEDEPERSAFTDVLLGNEPVMSAASVVEAQQVLRRRHRRHSFREVWPLVELQEIEVVPFDVDQARLAEDGLARFGRGRRRPPAVLNFGDLFAYALARKLDVPLLFKGDDFRATDIRPALGG
jgi:ribonuclease VapC